MYALHLVLENMVAIEISSVETKNWHTQMFFDRFWESHKRRKV